MHDNILKELDPLFNPKSVAHIGATNNRNKWGFSTITSLIDTFKGPIFPVNIHEDFIQGLRAYKRLTDIQEPVDLVVFTIPAEKVAEAMEDCVTKGIKSAVIISAGFAETGPEGKKLQDEVLRIARKGNIRFVGPNCMGYWSASSSLGAFMLPLPVRDGPLALVSQGGNVGAAIVIAGYQRGLGLHRYVSCGCAADIQIEDYIEYFGKDPEVKIILAYIEGLQDGIKFTKIVSEVTHRKPVIVLKPGKTEAVAKAIKSHSGALAGVDEIYNVAFKQMGALRVESPEEMLDVALGFLTQPFLPKGSNVAIITPGGSYGILCAEACEEDGLNVVKLPEKTIQELDKIFPPRWSKGNPIDPAGDRNFIAYLTAPQRVLSLELIDSLVFMGFGGFSLFGSMLLRQRSASERMTNPQEVVDRDASLKYVLSITEDIKSGDTQKMEAGIRNFIAVMGMLLGIKDNPEIDELALMFIAARRSGKLGDDILNDVIDFASGKALSNGSGRSRESIINNLIGRMLVGLVDQWIESFKKPVLTTTFTEELAKLIGNHFDYPSGKRAARVLAKLTEYNAYLRSIGALNK